MVDNESWLISIENSANYISEQVGTLTVKAVLERYDAINFEELNPRHYSEVFSELFAIEADLRS